MDSHPWIDFKFNLATIEPSTWILLGEILSKCDHVLGAPLQPAKARELNIIYLSKGIHATTSIEGNTLTEEEVSKRVKGELDLPNSLEYQGEEIDNLLSSLNQIREECETGSLMPLSIDRIKDFNRRLLQGQPLGEDVVPGEFRTHSVVVGNVYRGAPAEDCEYLMTKFIKFINEDLVIDHEVYRGPISIIRAILAHLYLAWIHPFGDGNGRTARLIEFQLLMEAGIPTPSAHLLSDFYNRSRAKYYRVLEDASRNKDRTQGLLGFIQYAIEGFADGLRAQIGVIESHQLEIAWVNYIHECFSDLPHSEAQQRKRKLALAMPFIPTDEKPVKKSDLPHLTHELSGLYANKDPKTLSRDVNDLLKMGLIVRRKGGYSSNLMLMAAFLPGAYSDESK